ncbi:MAG: ATP-dependent sacrificial sulfur transferase LarE [Desulfobacteraceae bacterium]|nr:ATP-dependent sacrificial sulfur transferase LarE [Desulfobacteraceae bacterium]
MASSLSLTAKKQCLFEIINGYASLGIAFSGGVDSTLLLAAAKHVLGKKVTAFTARSVIHPFFEQQEAAQLCSRFDVKHVFFDTKPLDNPMFRANSSERCYYCKSDLFKSLRMLDTAVNIDNFCHGANMDDLQDFRPGFRAAQEQGIKQPLIQAGLTKFDIRQMARQMGLPNWNKPAMACLASRIPYGQNITASVLTCIEKSEAFLKALGFTNVRVRHHDQLARIEVAREDICEMSRNGVRDQIATGLRDIGYNYVCLDLEGYCSGKMNRDILD